MNENGGPLDIELILSNGGVSRTLKDTENKIRGFTDKTVSETGRMDKAFNRLGVAVAGVFTARAAEQFIGQLIRVRGEFQQLNIAFTTMLGSKEKADALMQQVKQLAATTPFELQDVAQGAKQLIAYGFSADTVVDDIKKLGDVAAGVSAPLGDIVYLYGTLKTQGRAYAQDIRQFTNRGIPIIQELAKQFGVTQDKVMGLVSAGKVGFPEVKKAIEDMTKQGGKFYNLMAAQSKSLTGQISNLHDSWSFMINDIGKSQQGLLSDGISLAAELVANYKDILKVLGTIIATYGAYKAAVIALNVVQKINKGLTEGIALEQALAAKSGEALTVAQARRIVITKNLTTAQKGLNVAMEANPIGIVIATLTAGIVAYKEFYRDVVHVTDAHKAMAEAVKDVAKSVAEQQGKIEGLIAVLGNQNAAEKERQKAYEALKKISPDLVAGYNMQSNSIAQLNRNTKEYLLTVQKQAQITAYQDQLTKAYTKQAELEKEKLETQKQLQESGNGLLDSYAVGLRIRLNGINRNLQTSAENIAYWKKMVGQASSANTDNTATQKALNPTDAAKAKIAEQWSNLSKDVDKNFGQLIKIVSNKADLDQLKQALTDKLNSLAPNDAQIAELKQKLQRVAQVESVYSVKGGKTVGPAPVAPDIPGWDDLGKQLTDNLKKSLQAQKAPLVDIAEDVMEKGADKLKQSIQTIFDFKASSTTKAQAAAYFGHFWEEVMEDPFNDTISTLKDKIKDIDHVLDTGTYTSPLGDKINLTTDQIDKLHKAKKELQKLVKEGKLFQYEMQQISGIFGQLSSDTSDFDAGLSRAFGAMGKIAGYASDFKANVQQASAGFKAFEQTGGNIANLMSGIIGSLGAVGAAAGAVISIVSVISAARKQEQQEQAELDRQRAQAISRENELLIDQLAILNKLYGTERLQKYAQLQKWINKDLEKNTDLLKKNLNELILHQPRGTSSTALSKSLGDLENKDYDQFKRDIAGIQDSLSQTNQAAIQAVLEDADLSKELTQQIQENFTGISFDSLTDQIINMFEQGKTSAEDFADSFETLMKNAILSTFKTKYLADKLGAWYEEFTKDAESNSELTPAEISDLQKNYKKILTDESKKLDELSKAAGISITGTESAQSANSLAGAIQGMTSQQAGVLEGQFNAMRISQAEMTEMARQQLFALSGIEQNTRYNKHLAILPEMNKKLDNLKADPLRATGNIH